MIEEEKNEQAPEEESPPAEEAPAEETPVEDAPVEEAPVEEAPVEEPPAEEAPVEAEEAPAEEAEASEGEPEELGPKQRRKLERSRSPVETLPPRSSEERAAERADRRRRRAASRRSWRLRRREKDRAATAERPATPAVEAREHGPGKPRVRQGVVVSDKADKTITVRIDITRQHRQYKKVVRESSTLHAHDERNEAHAGDTVRVVESRPLSRTKRWRLVEIVTRAR